ncbi:MAG: SpoVG family protein [Candidatus Sumerlaeaceae bacterium]|nr:SpoVG family protein [Candidatus Sumerlaeaceae bacterium]
METLEVTNVTIRPASAADQKLKAFAVIVLNNAFVVRDLKVIEAESGRFVAMPSRRGRDGSFHDVAHPLNQEARSVVEAAVLRAYEDAMKTGGFNGNGNGSTIGH